MPQELPSARKHPAALAAVVIASVAVSALALVTIGYLLGWVPTPATVPAGPGSFAAPGQQLPGTMQDGVALLPGETLVEPADTPKPAPAAPPPAAPKPATPQYTKPAPLEPPRPAAAPAQKKAPAPIHAQPLAPSSSTSYATVLPSRAAPGKPNYNADAPATSYERSSRSICVNCGVISSIGSAGRDWEVRVRFDDGSIETLRYPDRPRLRIGERVHLEDGRLIPE